MTTTKTLTAADLMQFTGSPHWYGNRRLYKPRRLTFLRETSHVKPGFYDLFMLL